MDNKINEYFDSESNTFEQLEDAVYERLRSKTTGEPIAMTWEREIKPKLIGRRIVDVRYMTQNEADDMCFTHRGLVIFFDDGTYIFPIADDEGNDAGALSSNLAGLSIIPVI